MKAIDQGYTYEVDNVENGVQTIQFIRKEAKGDTTELETMIDGTTNEEVLAVLIDRIQFLDGKLPDDFNKSVLNHLNAAKQELENRTEERTRRGVEGTTLAVDAPEAQREEGEETPDRNHTA